MSKTIDKYNDIVSVCKDIFVKKTKDYGLSWKISRPTSLTDQIYIKALRIRNIEKSQSQNIQDTVYDEYIGIVNYCVITLIILNEKVINMENIQQLYDTYIDVARLLMLDKNKDYGEAWKYMRVSSYTDFILIKLERIKQMEDNQGKTLISEGIDANYLDILNYAIFALIKL